MNFSFQFIAIFILALLFSACQIESNEADSNESPTSVGMLQHNVYFYLNDDVTKEEREQFEEGLKTLLSIEEIYDYELGTPGATEERDVTDHSFGYVIFSWFKTLEDYKIYDEHPTHLEFIDKYNHLWSEVKVYDSEIIDSR